MYAYAQQRIQDIRNSIVFLKNPRYSDKDILGFAIKSALNNLKGEVENTSNLINLFNRGELATLKKILADEGVDWLIEDINLYERLSKF